MKASFPAYKQEKHGNVFDWIVSTAQQFRRIRHQERLEDLEKRQNDNQRNDGV